MPTVTGIALAALIAALAALSGCNTVRGVGKDLQYGGEKIYEACGRLGRGVGPCGKPQTPGKDRQGKDESSPSAQ